MFRFKCSGCGELHEGMPGFAADAPLQFYGVPEAERESRCELTADTCVIDGNFFFARGCVEIPVVDEDEPFVWGVWVSLSEQNFQKFRDSLTKKKRSHIGPLFGWLSAAFLVYPLSENLKAMLHLRDNEIRPFVELEPTEHPLAVEQRNGILADRVAEIYAAYMHQSELN